MQVPAQDESKKNVLDLAPATPPIVVYNRLPPFNSFKLTSFGKHNAKGWIAFV